MSDSPTAPWGLAALAADPDLTELGHLFADAGFEIAVVGGSVRDALMNRPAQDLDFATSALPDQTEAILARWGEAHWDIGKRFGTIGAVRRGVQVEVTTYRADAYEPDSRKPEVAFGDCLEEDLARRDFTANAMALRLPEPELVDPFGGAADLAAGLLRTPVEPERSFSDDPLRMMRAARFSAQLGWDIDFAAFRAMTQMAERIEIVSAERVRAEMEKLLLAPWPRRGLEAMVETGLAGIVLPELPALRLERDEHHHHKDVYEHTLTVLQQAMDLETGPGGPVPAPDLILRLAALLHDIGKPATRRFEPGGLVSFHHHEIVGAKMAAKRMRALRFDKDTTKAVVKLIGLHLRFHGYGEAEWTDSAVRRYVTDAGDQLERLHRLTRADCTTRNKRRADRLAHAYDDLEQRIGELAEQEELAAIRPALDGNEIMELLSLPPGRQVGEAYRFLLSLRMEQGPMPKQQATAALLEWWRSR